MNVFQCLLINKEHEFETSFTGGNVYMRTRLGVGCLLIVANLGDLQTELNIVTFEVKCTSNGNDI